MRSSLCFYTRVNKYLQLKYQLHIYTVKSETQKYYTMKHLSILSLSAAAILFLGAEFKQSHSYMANSKAIQTTITEMQISADQKLITESAKATEKVAGKVERTTINFVIGLIKAAF